MIENLSRYVDVLIKLQITPTQFLLPYCLVMDRLKESNKAGRFYQEKAGPTSPIANLYKYAGAEGLSKTWTNAEVEDMIEKGILVGTASKKDGVVSYYPDTMTVTAKFISLVFASGSEFDEFWEEYPPFANDSKDPLHGPKIVLKGVGYNTCRALYEENVKSLLTHERVMRALRWGKENGVINLGIVKFLESRHWEAIETLMHEHHGTPDATHPRGTQI